MFKKYYAIFMAAILLSACARKSDQPCPEITYSGNQVIIAEDSPILPKLQYEILSVKPFCNEFRTVGTVQAETGQLAEVNVPFDGRIVRSHVKLGTKVHAGQTLLEMSSPEFLEVSKEYFQSLQNYEKAKSDYERKKVLAQHGIVSQKDLQEAFAEAENSRHDIESAASTLKVYGSDPSCVKMGQAMNIVAPISGEIVQCNVTVGSFTKADSEPLMTIADLHKVWINARVKEHYIGWVSQGGKAEIRSEANPDLIIHGDILYVGNMVDEETRSVQVMIGCDNQDLQLKHGMFVSVHFLSEEKDAIVVPATAVFQGEQRCYVYVCTTQPNVFERREVELGSSNDENTDVSIKSGIVAGEKIISVGGLYLNN